MNALAFQFENAAVRVSEFDGAPWFVGADVARALGYLKPHDAIDRHCKGSVKHGPLSTAGGTQVVKFIGEADVLRLIVSSGLTTAVRFERWVFEEVLPQIRRTGQYAPVQHKVPQTFADALQLAADMARANTALEAKVAEQLPKVAALERISDAQGAMCLNSAAKHLQLAPRRFTDWLFRRGWIFRRSARWYAYQEAIDRGYLVQKAYVYQRDTDGDHVSEQVRVTAKGLARLAEMLESPKDIAAGRAIETLTEALH